MAVGLNISNYFSLTDVVGLARSANQGAFAGNAASTPVALNTSSVPAITGTVHSRTGSIATATVNTLYNSANDLPATFVYGFFLCSQDCYLQLIGSSTNHTRKIIANVPELIQYGKQLAAANQTLITGGAEPTLEAIAKVVLGNYSGNTAYYSLFLVN